MQMMCDVMSWALNAYQLASAVVLHKQNKSLGVLHMSASYMYARRACMSYMPGASMYDQHVMVILYVAFTSSSQLQSYCSANRDSRNLICARCSSKPLCSGGTTALFKGWCSLELGYCSLGWGGSIMQSGNIQYTTLESGCTVIMHSCIT